VCSKKISDEQISVAVKEKAGLMAEHYDLTETVGRHGEKLVASVCEDLGYSQMEMRKEKHGSDALGIGHHDIDVFALHPSGDYYQYIEVKNRRAHVNNSDLMSIINTASTAQTQWKLDIRPAIVAPFFASSTVSTASNLGVPIAYSEGVYVPEAHRELYEKLNSRLALNVIITDKPTEVLRVRIRKYISKT
jgi:hypothetical protein